jgi:hypothetical protein
MQPMITDGTTLAGYYLSNSTANGHIVPGSGNHWSDAYRGEHGNFMLMNSTTFDNTYGGGSFNKAVALFGFGRALKKSWSAGEISLADVSLMNLEWNELGGLEVMRKSYTENGTSYLDIYYEEAWTLQKNQNAATNQLFGGIDTQNGGGDGSLAIDIASGGATGFGLATSLRYKLEWEYLRQARINRTISGDFSKPIKHSLRTIRGFGTGFTVAGGFIGVVNFGLSDRSWGDYGQLGVSLLSTGLTFGSVTAPIGIGIGLIDTFGGLNGFYNYLDNQQNFYNNAGGIIVPVNGIPSFIPLK